jgi:hypothetical protein
MRRIAAPINRAAADRLAPAPRVQRVSPQARRLCVRRPLAQRRDARLLPPALLPERRRVLHRVLHQERRRVRRQAQHRAQHQALPAFRARSPPPLPLPPRLQRRPPALALRVPRWVLPPRRW